MRRSRRVALVALIALSGAACGAPQGGAEGPEPPPIPTNFTPAPRLGPEPPGAGIPGPGSDWLEAVHAELHPRWADNFLEQCRLYLPPEHPLNDPRLEVTLHIAVSIDGTVRNVDVARSSGNPDFDGAAREMLLEASPLPPPPAELASDDGDVHLGWRFARDVRQDGTAGASIERLQWEPERAVPALLAAGRVDEAAARVAGLYEGGGKADPGRHALARQVAGGTLIAALGSDDDPAARVEAVRALAAAGHTPAAPALRVLAAEGNDIGVQTAALRALGELRDAEAEPVLIEALARVDGERGAAAAAALTRLGKGEAVWEVLGPRAQGADARVRASAIGDLAEAGLPESQPLLVATLADRARPRGERSAAAQALGPLAREARGPAARALAAALTDGDAAVRAAAAAALARAAEGGLRGRGLFFAVEPLLRDRDPRVQAAAVRAAARLHGEGALAELVLVAARARDPQLLAATIDAVGDIPGPGAVAQLRRWTGSKNPDVRLAAYGALARRPEPEARALVARAPAAEDPRLAALAVGASDDRAALERALGDPNPEARAAAVRPLAKVAGVDAAIPLTLRALAASHGPRERVLLARELLAIVPK
jgi:TonB family protein